jgi:hypothetical protein
VERYVSRVLRVPIKVHIVPTVYVRILLGVKATLSRGLDSDWTGGDCNDLSNSGHRRS